MEDKGKTKVELIKELKTLRKKGEKSAVNNIIERKQAEEKLKDSEEYLQVLFDYAPDAYFISDLKGDFIDGNRAAERLTGYKKEELIGKNFLKLKLLSTTDVPKEAKLFTKELRELPTGTSELVLSRKDNTKVTVEISAYLIKIKGRTLVLGIVRGITKRKETEKTLAESEEKYHTVFENAGTAIMVIEEDETISMVNTQYEKLSGYSKKEIENKMKWADLIVPEDLERVKRYHITRRKARGKAPSEYEFRMIDKKGNIKNIFLKTGMMSNSKRSIASLTDITERKRAEERIKHLDLVIHAIRNVNQLIVKEKDRERLLKGVCDSLIKTRGYYHARIVLLNEEGKISTHIEAALRKDFLPLVKLLKESEMTPCGQRALKQEEVVIIEDPASACTDCPLVPACSAQRGVMTIRLEYHGRLYGKISVSIPVHFINDKEEHALFKEVAGDIALGLHSIEMREKLDKQTYNLQQNYQKTKRAMDATIETMSKIVEAKDPYTAGHQQRVSQLTIAIAKELNFSEDKIEGIRIASLIHDIGRSACPLKS